MWKAEAEGNLEGYHTWAPERSELYRNPARFSGGEMTKEENNRAKAWFLEKWRESGMDWLEFAVKTGVDPLSAFRWVREHREELAKPSPADLLHRAMLLAARAREMAENPHLPAEAIVALNALGNLLNTLEEGWHSLVLLD